MHWNSVHCVFQFQNGNSSEELYIPGKFEALITQFDKSGSTPWSKLMFNVTILIFVSPNYSLYRTEAYRKAMQEARITGNRLIHGKRETRK